MTAQFYSSVYVFFPAQLPQSHRGGYRCVALHKHLIPGLLPSSLGCVALVSATEVHDNFASP